MVSAWEETPVHHLRLDVRSLLQDAVITEVRAHHKRLTFVIVMKTYERYRQSVPAEVDLSTANGLELKWNLNFPDNKPCHIAFFAQDAETS